MILLFLRVLYYYTTNGYRVSRSFTPHLPLNATIQFSRLFAWHEDDHAQCYLEDHGRVWRQTRVMNTNIRSTLVGFSRRAANTRPGVFPKNLGENWSGEERRGYEEIRSPEGIRRCVPKRNRFPRGEEKGKKIVEIKTRKQTRVQSRGRSPRSRLHPRRRRCSSIRAPWIASERRCF